MKSAEDKNTSPVKGFVQKMNSFVSEMSVQTSLMSSVGATTKEEMIEAMKAPCVMMNSLSEEVSSNAENISTMTKNCFQVAAELEKRASIQMNTLSAEIRERWEASLKMFRDYYINHSERSEALNKQMISRLDQVKQYVTEFSDDIRPQLTEIRGTVCENVEKRAEQGGAVAENVKTACTEMADSLKAMLSKLEQMSMHVEDQHKQQVICDQEAQEKVISALETAGTVVQSHEDIIHEQCDVDELQGQVKEVLQGIDSNFNKEVDAATSSTVQDEANMNNMITNLIGEADANRTDSNMKMSKIIEVLVGNGEQCQTTSKLVKEKTGDIALGLESKLDNIEETSKTVIENASESVKNVCLVHVDPTASVPDRVEQIFPQHDEPPHLT